MTIPEAQRLAQTPSNAPNYNLSDEAPHLTQRLELCYQPTKVGVLPGECLDNLQGAT
jgi:hypothetical protein